MNTLKKDSTILFATERGWNTKKETNSGKMSDTLKEIEDK
jgi:hypothetical protein